MKKKSFTLMELLFAFIIMSIIATLAFPTYKNFIEDSRSRVCETNLRALKTALDIYAMDHDIMPASLGQLPQEYLDKAYAQLMQRQDDWKMKLANTILEWSESGLRCAEAATPNFLYLLSKKNLRMITCPGTRYPPQAATDGSISSPSYQLNPIIILMTALQYRNIPPNTAIIFDIRPHHKHYTSAVSYTEYSNGITFAGNITQSF